MSSPTRRCVGCTTRLPPPPAKRGNARKWCSEACRVRTHRRRGPSTPDTCSICAGPSLTGARCAVCRRYGSPVSRLRIFERDDWICRICAEPVDSARVWPDPLAATIDHRVPRSRGGEDSDANVQCAHFGCNVRKSNHLDYAVAA